MPWWSKRLLFVIPFPVVLWKFICISMLLYHSELFYAACGNRDGLAFTTSAAFPCSSFQPNVQMFFSNPPISEAGVDPYFCNNWHGALNLHLNPGTDPRSDHYRFVMVVSTEQRRWDPHARKCKQANSSLSSFHTSTIIRLFPAKFPTVLCLFLLLTLSASSQGRMPLPG